jgi:hypothetical protein
MAVDERPEKNVDQITNSFASSQWHIPWRQYMPLVPMNGISAKSAP